MIRSRVELGSAWDYPRLEGPEERIEVDRPPPGGFYWCWVPPDIVGPFEGGRGTRGW